MSLQYQHPNSELGRTQADCSTSEYEARCERGLAKTVQLSLEHGTQG